MPEFHPEAEHYARFNGLTFKYPRPEGRYFETGADREVEFATDHGIPVFFGTAEEFVDHYSRGRVV